jgi:serine/threonine protein kinase
MLRATDAFLEQLRDLDLLPAETVSRFTAEEPAAVCAQRLIEAGLLTTFQVEQVLAGKGRRLRVGAYVLLERLGRGGMGHVYKAQHRLLKRVAALKIIGRARSGCDAAARRRFRREVEAAGRLRHPHIVTTYDAGICRGRPYLAMEYVEGVDLQRLVESSGPLTIDLACEIVRQTAEALHHAHERGLVHRDIKPSNLMLASPGINVKLLDLGLAHLTDSDAILDEADEALCGTPDFMAPEWGHDPRRANVRGDLYSLGCTFYFLLCGRVPYPGGSGTEKLLRHCLDEPAPLPQLRPEVPPPVAAIVQRLMARDADRRYGTGAAVAADLAALSFTPLTTTKEEKIEAPSPSSSRPRAARFSLAALTAILLGVAAAGGARWMASPSTTTPSTRSQRSVGPAPAVGGSSNKPTPSPFVLAGRAESFSSLGQAIAAARDGDVIEIHAPGPFLSGPLSWRSKALTVRGGKGIRPRLEMKTGDDPWPALLQTDRTLTLEGIDLAAIAANSRPSKVPTGPLIRCQQADVRLTNCRLIGGAGAAALVARRPGEVVLRGCRIDAGSVGLSVEVGEAASCRISLDDCRLHVREQSGAALSLWGADLSRPSPVELQLRGNTIQAGRTAALRAFPAQLTITAHDNRFRYGRALLSYSGFAERDAWRGTVWQGGGNRYEGPSSWLWVEDRPVVLPEPPRPR